MRIKHFDVSASNAIKGIAIIMMLFHHNIYSMEVFSLYNMVSLLPPETVYKLASASKMCVSLFTFVSGYGLYLSYKKSNKNWILVREIKMLSKFWFVFILVAIATQFLGKRVTYVFFQSSRILGCIEMLIDFLGCARIFSTATLNGTWWYMSAAIIYILLVPLLLMDERALPSCFLAVCILPIALGCTDQFYGVQSFYAFLPAFILGMLFAKYDWLNRYLNLDMNRYLKFLITLLGVVIVFGVYPYLDSNINFRMVQWNILPIPLILFIAEFLSVKSISFLGKHATNIFLFHTVLRAMYFKELVYAVKPALLNIIVFLLECLVISIIIEKLKDITHYDKLINRILSYATKFADAIFQNSTV